MFPTGIIDLHCDTLTRDMWASQPPACGPLVNPAYHIALGKMPRNLRWVQCFAIFVPDNYRGQALFSTGRWWPTAIKSPPAGPSRTWSRPWRPGNLPPS